MSEAAKALPRHVAIILDGNGRWARSKGMPRNYGHAQGAKNVETVCRAAHDMGIEYLTVYAFSTENWNRPQDEVNALMKLLDSYMENCLKTAKKNNMRVRVLGDKNGLAPRLQEKIARLEEASSGYDGLRFQIALNYGGQDEIVRAVRRIMQETAQGLLAPADMTIERFAQYLDTAGIPEPDLLIRTSGEQRISNFLPWQLAYTELYFTPVPWPDFDGKELQKAVDDYQMRDRRYGSVKEE